MLFYSIPRVVLAPNRELRGLMERGTGNPVFLMSRGVDTELFTPARRRANKIVNIGYVGRLSAEKNVRLLHALEAELDAEGLDVRFTIVGDGSERDWLRRNMLRAEFTGVLRGPALAEAYAQMDIFAFPPKPTPSATSCSRPWPPACPRRHGHRRAALCRGIQHWLGTGGNRGERRTGLHRRRSRPRQESSAPGGDGDRGPSACHRFPVLGSHIHGRVRGVRCGNHTAKSRSREFGTPHIVDLLAP